MLLLLVVMTCDIDVVVAAAENAACSSVTSGRAAGIWRESKRLIFSVIFILLISSQLYFR